MLLAQGRSGDRVVSKQPGQDGEAILESPAVQREFFEESAKTDDSRITPRFTLLIRAAKLICQQGEFICVIRDISSTGVSLRLFHALPRCDSFVLEFQTGHCSKVRNVCNGRHHRSGRRWPSRRSETDRLRMPGARLQPQATT